MTASFPELASGALQDKNSPDSKSEPLSNG